MPLKMNMRSLSRQEVRRVDKVAIEQLGVCGLVLMENAGRNAADAIEQLLLQRRPELCWWLNSSDESPSNLLSQHSVAVVAGAGNNGGDGMVVARHLAMRGATVTTFLLAGEDKFSGDAKANLTLIQKLQLDVQPVRSDDLKTLSKRLSGFDLIVDAIGGTGIQGELRGDAATAVEQVNASGRPVVAIDIPTGLDCDTGKAEGPAIRAAMTVTFVARKMGFDVPGAQEFTGQVLVADIGIDPAVVLGK